MAQDDFNRANENPIVGPWAITTGHGNMQVLSNQCDGAGVGTDNSCYWNVGVFTDDQFCEITYTADNQDSGPCVWNKKSAATMYLYDPIASGGSGALCKIVAGVFTPLSVRDVVWANGDRCRLQVTRTPTGARLRVFQNDAQIGAFLDDNSIAPGGAPGIFSSGTAQPVDNFLAGSVSVPASLGWPFHPGQSPGLGGISSARFQMYWWPYAPPVTVSFDPALMCAMDRPWRDTVISQPQVVASGMTPPESKPN